MPRLTNEKSRSPERVSRRSRFRPSSPIEIPTRHRPTHASKQNSDSPDMIFDMSPLSPRLSPLSTIYPLSRSTSVENIVHEPFMYAILTLRSTPCGNGAQLRSKISRQRIMPSRSNSGTVPFGSKLLDRHSPSWSKRRLSDDAHGISPQHGDHDFQPTQFTTKITGFVPINEDQPPNFGQISRPTIPLHPPPRRSSYSSSPWILPEKPMPTTTMPLIRRLILPSSNSSAT